MEHFFTQLHFITEKLPLYIVILPLLGAPALALFKRSEPLRNLVALLVSGGTFLLCALLFVQALEGPVTIFRPHFLGIGLQLQADVFGALFALFASLIWFLAVLFSWSYMSHEQQRTRFYVFLILTLAGCSGVFLSGDLFTFFLFFELMSLSSFVLVIHAQDREAMDAGRNYLYLSIIGGLSLLAGILLLYTATGNIALTPQLELLEAAGPVRYFILAFLITGFGIKAGMVPLHIWLPKAHPVAPSPASALLSGIMIKTGAYGIIRALNLIFTPAGGAEAAWEFPRAAGFVIIWLAIVTMLSAALMALFQTNIKRILAYSSISQMGYILMGVGCAAYLGYKGAMGFGGFTYHILNHAFFKAGLFMMAGAVYARTHELELSRLGGLARCAPVTAASFLVCAAGIAGFPGFNGYISKTLLHHAIVEAYELHHLWTLKIAELLFTLTGALTVCYVFKLFTGIFAGPRPAHLKELPREPFVERVVFATVAAAVVALGTAPQKVLEKVIVPAAGSFVYDPYSVKYLLKQNFLHPADLLGVIIPIILGLTLLYVMKRKELFQKISLPAWLSVDRYVYAPVSSYSLSLFTVAGNMVERNIDRSYLRLPEVFAPVYRSLKRLEEDYLVLWGRQINALAVQIRETLYSRWVAAVKAVFGNLGRALFRGFRTLFRVDSRPRESTVFQMVNMSNLDFNLLVIVLTLIIILGITFILR